MRELGIWLRAERGRMGIGHVVLVLLVTGAVYAAIVFVPAYIEYYKFEEKLKAVANLAHRDKDVDRLRKEILEESRILGLNLPPDAVVVELDPHGRWVEISARYARVVELVPFGAETTLTFEARHLERF